MKKILTVLLLQLGLISLTYAQEGKACDPAKEAKWKSLSKPNKAGGYGDVITKDKAQSLAEVEKGMQASHQSEVNGVKISGKVSDVCKTKGCWMTVDKGNGENVRIRFKDYAFFVPRNCEGQTVYAMGEARYDTTSVAMLKHYAEDAKKSKSEIDAITKPEIELTFEASGVLFDEKK